MNKTTILNGVSVPLFSCGCCPTCGHAPAIPYRRIVGGVIVEGCVDRAHTGHLYGNSAAWHGRPTAKAVRAETRRSERAIVIGDIA